MTRRLIAGLLTLCMLVSLCPPNAFALRTSATDIPVTEPAVVETQAEETETKATEPAPTETKATEPAPTETKETEPAPTETKETEPAPTETKATEPAPTETKATEPKPTEAEEEKPKTVSVKVDETITLTATAEAGGSWSSSNNAAATAVGRVEGGVTQNTADVFGVAAGFTTVTYTLGDSVEVWNVTVTAAPAEETEPADEEPADVTYTVTRLLQEEAPEDAEESFILSPIDTITVTGKPGADVTLSAVDGAIACAARLSDGTELEPFTGESGAELLTLPEETPEDLSLSVYYVKTESRPDINDLTILEPKTKIDTYQFVADDKVVDTQLIKTGDTIYEPAAPEKPGYKFVGWYKGETEFNFSEPAPEATGGPDPITITARFQQVYYVFFYNNDGAVCATREGINGTEIKADVTFPVNANEAITGWYEDAALTKRVDSVTLNNANVTLYPEVKEGFWITFNADGGTYTAPVFVAPNTNTVAPDEPTRVGYTFQGWYNGNSKFEFGSKLPENVTLTASWKAASNTKYRVIHWQENANDDGFSFKESEEKTGTTGAATTAEAKSYEGFKVKNFEQKTIAGDGSTIVNVYYDRIEYEVQFYKDISGRSELTNLRIKAKYGAYIGNKWPTYNGSSLWIKSSTFWETTYQANIDTMPLGGGKFYYSNRSGKENVVPYFVEALNQDGSEGTKASDGLYYVLHHNDTSKGTAGLGVTDEDRYPITGFTVNTTLSSKNEDSYGSAEFYYYRNSYEVKFINNGAEDSRSFKYQQSLKGISYTPDRPDGISEDYEFAGWYDNQLGQGEEYVFSGTMPANNITVYAKWAPPTVSGTAYLTMDGVDSEPIQVTYGSTIDESTLPTDVAKANMPAGYTWRGWATKDEEGNYKPFNFDTQIFGDITLYPYYTNSIKYIVKYTGEGVKEYTDPVRYADGGDADIKSPTFENAPTDKVFLGWSYNGKIYYPGDKLQIRSLELDKDVTELTLTAVWGEQAKPAILTYYANDGTNKSVTDELTQNNRTVTLPHATALSFDRTDEGYEFLGWAKTQNATTPDYEAADTIVVDNNGTNKLYAVWKLTKQPYTIKYYKDSISDANYIDQYDGEATKVGTEVTVSVDLLNAERPDGYAAKTAEEKIIITADAANNVLNVVYTKRTDLSYTVKYQWNGKDIDSTRNKLVKNQTFGSTSAEEYPESFDGYTPKSMEARTITIDHDEIKNVIIIEYYKNVTLVANSDTFTYDGNEKTVSGYTCKVGEDTVTATFNIPEPTRTETNAGEYAVEFKADYTPEVNKTVSTDGNYLVTAQQNGKLTIEKSNELTVSGTGYNDVYDGQAHGAAAVAKVNGAVAEATISYSVDGGSTWSSTVPTITDVGKVTVSVKAENSNYETATASYTLEVTKRPVTVTGDGWDTDQLYTGTEYKKETYTFYNVVSDQTATISYSIKGTEIGSYTGEFGECPKSRSCK